MFSRMVKNSLTLSAEGFEERQVHDLAACQQLQAAVWTTVKLVLLNYWSTNLECQNLMRQASTT